MEYIDLHIHTTASDGSFSPTEVVKTALEKGLYAIAITDHDTVAGVSEAKEAASGHPLHVISGVEISSVYNGRDIHVLGLNIDHENKFLLDTLKTVENMRLERNMKMCEHLREHGMEITIDELYSRSSSNILTRGDMGHLMIDKGYVKDMQEAFDLYLSSKAKYPCYVPRFKMPADDVYKLVTYAGGICSLAHPVQYKMKNDEEYLELFRHLKQIGFKCIEAIHSDNKENDEKRFTDMAATVGLKITGGSDFHGASKVGVSIGTGRGNVMVPRSFLKNIGITDY